MEIREVLIEDLNSLADLFTSYRVFYRKTPDIAGARKFLKERIIKKDSEIYVYESDGRLAGFVQLYPIFSSTRMKKAWLLNDLFVDEEYRGKGVSTRLIERAKKLVKETGAFGMMLETEKTNVIGNSLYPRAGFRLNEAANFYEWEVENG